MCGSSATAASVRLEVRGQQPSTAELRDRRKDFPRPLRYPEVDFEARKKGSRLRLPFNRSFLHRYCAAGFLRCVAGAFLAGAFLGAAFVSSAPLFMVITKGLGS